jgi:hypothetical protein
MLLLAVDSRVWNCCKILKNRGGRLNHSFNIKSSTIYIVLLPI